MKSLKKFKNQLVFDKECSSRVDDTVKKISEIRASGYKLDSKSTNRRDIRTSHSIQSKSPIRIPKRLARVKTSDKENSTQNYKSQEIADFKIKRPDNNVSDFDASDLNLKEEDIQCLREMWTAVQKLRGKKCFARYMDEIKGIINKICIKGTKPEFLYRIQSETSERKQLRVPSISSKAALESPNNQKEYPVDSEVSSFDKRSSITVRDYVTTSFNQPSTATDTLQYKKILYMLDAESRVSSFHNSSNSTHNLQKYQKSVDNQTYKTSSQAGSIVSREAQRHPNKHMVLQEIVEMLNTKYRRKINLK